MLISGHFFILDNRGIEKITSQSIPLPLPSLFLKLKYPSISERVFK